MKVQQRRIEREVSSRLCASRQDSIETDRTATFAVVLMQVAYEKSEREGKI